MFLSIFAPLLGERLLFQSASVGERESLFAIFHSLSVFLLEWRELLIWITFIAAL